MSTPFAAAKTSTDSERLASAATTKNRQTILSTEDMDSSDKFCKPSISQETPPPRMTMYESYSMDESVGMSLGSAGKHQSVARTDRSTFASTSKMNETTFGNVPKNDEHQPEPSPGELDDFTAPAFRRKSSLQLNTISESYKKFVNLTGIEAMDPEDVEDIANITSSRILNFETTFMSEQEEKEEQNKEEDLEKRKVEALKIIEKYKLPMCKAALQPSPSSASSNESARNSSAFAEMRQAGPPNVTDESFLRRKHPLRPEDITIDLSGYDQFRDVIMPAEACQMVLEHFKQQELKEKTRAIEKEMAKLEDPRQQNVEAPSLTFLLVNKRQMET